MTSIPIISNSGLSIAHGNWKFATKRSNCRTNYRSWACSLSTSAALFSRELNNYCWCKSQNPLTLRGTKIKPLINKGRKTYSVLENKENNDSRKKLSLRLQPKLKCLSSRLRKVSVRSVLSGLVTFFRKNTSKVTISTCVSLVLGLCLLFLKVTSRPPPKVVPYSELVASIQNGVVPKVLFEEGTRRIFYNTNSDSAQISENEVSAPQPRVTEDDSGNGNKKIREGDSVWTKISKGQSSARMWQFSTRKIDHDEGYLLALMREKGTSYGSAPQSFVTSMRSLLITVLTLWIPLTPLMYLLYRQLSAANSPAKKRRPTNQLIGFEDVEGVDTAKTELMEVVSCLQGAVNYSKLGAKLPRGVLLVGPPGTGKTLLARAVAGEAGVPFFSVSASEFVELFVGRGASRIRDLFNIARKNAPSIIFIDELDAVGGKRGRSFNDERDQTLNQLLTEMDGFESGTSIVVIGATNRPEALDQALCRPGRFSRKVYVGEPDEDGRKKILAVHFREVPLEEDVDLICNLVASLTEGFVGADLANIVNEAALLAARRGAECVAREDVMEAVERAKFGINNKSLRPSTLSREIGKLFPWVPSLIPRNDTRQDGPGGHLGYQTLS